MTNTERGFFKARITCFIENNPNKLEHVRQEAQKYLTHKPNWDGCDWIDCTYCPLRGVHIFTTAEMRSSLLVSCDNRLGDEELMIWYKDQILNLDQEQPVDIP